MALFQESRWSIDWNESADPVTHGAPVPADSLVDQHGRFFFHGQGTHSGNSESGDRGGQHGTHDDQVNGVAGGSPGALTGRRGFRRECGGPALRQHLRRLPLARNRLWRRPVHRYRHPEQQPGRAASTSRCMCSACRKSPRLSAWTRATCFSMVRGRARISGSSSSPLSNAAPQPAFSTTVRSRGSRIQSAITWMLSARCAMPARRPGRQSC